MAELEKEAEEFRKNLKEQIIADDDFERLEQFDVNVEESYIAGTKAREKRIAKAKEIIKDFLLWGNSWHEKTESKYALLKRAEDFLKGAE